MYIYSVKGEEVYQRHCKTPTCKKWETDKHKHDKHNTQINNTYASYRSGFSSEKRILRVEDMLKSTQQCVCDS